ncbi:MAG: CatA-like O-acetyltransferase [Bacteroidota bacterium]
MKKIKFDNPHRQKHFEFFSAMNHPHFNITAPVTIGPLMNTIQRQGLSLTPTFAYLFARVANEIPQFRWRLRDGEVIEHEIVHPSFAVETLGTDVFSFCEVAFRTSHKSFYDAAQVEIKKMGVNPSFEDEEGRDDYLFMSAIPWIPFTSLQHAMNYHPHDSIPRISWGKYTSDNGKTQLPVSVQTHHALVDGRQVGYFFQRIEALAHQPNTWLNL